MQDKKNKSRIKEIYQNRTRKDKQWQNTGGTGQSDPLNLFLVTLTQRSRKSRTKLEKTRTTNQRGKSEKSKLKLLNKKVTGCNTNLTQI